MKRFAICTLLLFYSIYSFAFDVDSIHSTIGVGFRGGYAFNSNSELMRRLDHPNSDITHSALSFNVNYAISGLGNRTKSVYQGLGVGLTSFNAPKSVGTPISIYVFQGAPFVILSRNLSFDYEWNFGFAPGWHKTPSGFELKSNLVVGSSTNAYLNLRFKTVWQFNPRWNINAAVDLSHFSNGNTSWPNPGVNTIGATIGLAYDLGECPEKQSPFRSDPDFKSKIVYDIMGYGAWRTCYFPYERAGFDAVGEAYLLPGHFAVAGVNFAPLWWFHPSFRTGLSADFQWAACNALIQDGYTYRKPDFYKQLTLGLSARAELVMPIFTLNVGIGYGLLGSWETRQLYQTINLKTYIAGGTYINIGYRLNKFRSPSNLMLGIGYTIGQ